MYRKHIAKQTNQRYEKLHAASSGRIGGRRDLSVIPIYAASSMRKSKGTGMHERFYFGNAGSPERRLQLQELDSLHVLDASLALVPFDLCRIERFK